MTKQKKMCFIAVSVLVVFTILLLFFLFRKGKTYPISYSETSLYVPLVNGELLELTEDGTVYRYGNDDERTMLLDASDILYLSVVYDAGGLYMVNLHRDGTIGVCKGFDFKEKEITCLNEVVKVNVLTNGFVVLTENGEVFEGDIPNGWRDFYNSKEEYYLQLIKVKELSEVIDISATWEEKACLTKSGEVWVKGKYISNNSDEYVNVSSGFSFKRICNAGYTILALEKDGFLYEIGLALDEKNHNITNEHFRKVTTYDKVISFHAYGEQAALLNEKGDVHYFGHRTVGKSAGEPWGKSLTWLKNEKQVFFFGNYIYVLGKDYLYIREVSI